MTDAPENDRTATGHRPGQLAGGGGPAAGSREGAHAGGRRHRGGPSAAADGRGGRHDPGDRRARAGSAAGRLRGPATADRLLPHVARRQVQPRTSARAARSSTGRSRELSYLHSRDVTFATFCAGPVRRRASPTATSWAGTMPWYSARDSADALLAGRWFGMTGLLPARGRAGVTRRTGPAAAALR